MLQIKEIRLKLPNWKWWEYLMLITGIIMLIRGDYQTLIDWINVYLQR